MPVIPHALEAAGRGKPGLLLIVVIVGLIFQGVKTIFGQYSEAIFETIFGPDHKKNLRDPPNFDTILSSATRILGVHKGGGAATQAAATRRRRQRGSRASAAGITAAGRR